MKRVVILFADAWAAIESAWSLRDNGFEVVALARGCGRVPMQRVRGVRVVGVCPPEEDVKRTLADVRRVLDQYGPATLMPLEDPAIWVADRLAADDVSTTVVGPTGSLAQLALDKRIQIELAARSGLLVPTDGVGEDPPWMVKPALAIVEADGRLRRPNPIVAWTPADVRRAEERIGGAFFVQQMVAGTGEGIFGLATGRGVRAWSAHQRIRMVNPRGSGSSACRSIPVDASLRRRVERFLEEAEWHGLFMMEFIRDGEGRPWFMEMNGRPWGSIALSRHRGLDYPSWAASLALDTDFEPVVPDDLAHTTARHLANELIHLAAVIKGAPAARRAGAPWPSVGRSAASVLRLRRSDRWYNWRPGEKRVFVSDTFATIGTYIRRYRLRSRS
jgi:hypothetical protein